MPRLGEVRSSAWRNEWFLLEFVVVVVVIKIFNIFHSLVRICIIEI